jgi:hypothetical protein
MLGMTSASASAIPNAVKTIPSLDSGGIGCTSTRCVITGSNNTTGSAGTAVVNASNGAVKLGADNGAFIYESGPACPDKATCIGLGEHNFFIEAVTISTKGGAQKVVSKLSQTTDKSSAFSIACPSARYCLVGGSTPEMRAVLLKVSPTGRLLKKTVDKSYEGYGAIACESARTCLVTRAVATRRPFEFTYQSVTLVNGKFGKKSYRYPKNYAPFHVSCYSGKLCYSSGFNDTTAGNEVPEVIPLSPKTGAPGKAVKLPLADTGLVDLGVACYSSTQCVVVGAVTKGTSSNQTTHAAYAIIDKGKLRRPVVVSTILGSDLTAVACASPKKCYAIGSYYDPKINGTPTLLAKV